MDGKLLCKVVQRIERMASVEPFLILAVAAFDLAVVTRGIRTNELVPDAEFCRRPFKQRRQVTPTVGETVGKLKAVVRLDTLDLNPPASIPLDQLFQEVCGGIGGLLWIGGEKPQPRELVDGGVSEQTKLRICNAGSGNHLHIHLNALSGMGHLLVGLRFVRLFRLFSRKHAHFAHNAEQALRAPGVAALPQTVPQLNHAQRGIPAAHVTNELQFSLCVLVRMAVRASGLTGQGRHTTVPALLPEVDVRPVLVVFPAGAADAVFLCVLH